MVIQLTCIILNYMYTNVSRIMFKGCLLMIAQLFSIWEKLNVPLFVHCTILYNIIELNYN